MNNRKTDNTPIPKWIFIFPALFVPVAVILIIGMTCSKLENDKFMETAVAVRATCTEVREAKSRNSEGHESIIYLADVRYEYNGVSYEQHDIHVDKDTRVGDVITIAVDPNDPFDAHQPVSNREYLLLCIGIAIMTVVVIIITVVVAMRNRKPKSHLKEPWER